MATMSERFWDKVDKRDPNDCWEWTACKHPKGYGEFRFDNIKYRAHRLSYELAHGSFPAELHVLHRCDNPCCVNPNHLFLGTNQDNMNDRTTKGRHHNSHKTHCKYGHEFDEENTYLDNRGKRQCRECKRECKKQLRLVGGVA